MTKEKITLIGAADSIGVPYTKDNHTHNGFYEMIEAYLHKRYNVTSINCFHMSTYNDNQYIKRLISERITLSEIKHNQNQMLKKCKYSGLYPFLELPKSFLRHYKIENEDKTIIVRSYIRNTKTIFIYSAFVNDLLKARNLSLFKLLNPHRLKRELLAVNVEPVFNALKANLDILLALNPETKIYIVGLFVPTKIQQIRKGLVDFIEDINSNFLQLSMLPKYKNHVFVINNNNLTAECFNNIDFHPNQKGHEKIYQNFLKIFNI